MPYDPENDKPYNQGMLFGTYGLVGSGLLILIVYRDLQWYHFLSSLLLILCGLFVEKFRRQWFP